MFCLPTAGRRVQLFHLIFTQPGAHLLDTPCISTDRFHPVWYVMRQISKPGRRESFLLMSGSVLLLSVNAMSKFLKPFNDIAKRGLPKYS